MRTYRVSSFAKVNLGLTIEGRYEDGFHALSTVMQVVTLADVLTFTFDQAQTSGIRIHAQHAQIPKDQSNLIHRAAEAFSPELSFDVDLDKRIPLGAGLGGGSSNAASTLAVLARDKAQMPPDQLPDWRQRCLALGADVPFFIHGGTQHARGRGEQLAPLSYSGPYFVILLCPPVHAETGRVYRAYDEMMERTDPGGIGMEEVAKALATGELDTIWPDLRNDLEVPLFKCYPVLKDWREWFGRAVGRVPKLTGSGASYFVIDADAERAQWQMSRLKERLPDDDAQLLGARFRSGPGWQIDEMEEL